MATGLVVLQQHEVKQFVRCSEAVDEKTRNQALEIVQEVRIGGEESLINISRRFGDLAEGTDCIVNSDELFQALQALPEEQRMVLERTAERIRAFAQAQRNCLTDLTVPVPGGYAGHKVDPVNVAGCYAPGGRVVISFPLLFFCPHSHSIFIVSFLSSFFWGGERGKILNGFSVNFHC